MTKEIIIVGPGGNGQTFFMKNIREFTKINSVHDYDKLKHSPKPDKFFNDKKIIFIYGKSFNTVCSHFSKGWFRIQIKKLGNGSNLNLDSIKNIDDYFKLVEKKKKDLFSIEYQFKNWLNFKGNIYFLDIKNINTKELANFINCKEDIIKNIKDKIKISQKYDDLRKKYNTANEIYTNLDNFIKNKSLIKNNGKLNINKSIQNEKVKLDLLVVGSGGNGQTFIMKELSKRFKINRIGDKDGLKHISKPKNKIFENYNVKKYLFIYNRAFDSICSHFRRNWQLSQINKLGNIYNLKKKDLLNIDKYFSLVEEKKNKDLFSIFYQFMNWVTFKGNIEIYFINTYNIKIEELAKYLETDIAFIESIKNKVKKKDSYINLKNKYPNAHKLYMGIDKKINMIAQMYNKLFFENNNKENSIKVL